MNPDSFATSELFRVWHISSILFVFQLILMMSVSCRRVRPASSGMRSVSLSSWHRGGSSSATTSSTWCLSSSLPSYWPPGLYATHSKKRFTEHQTGRIVKTQAAVIKWTDSANNNLNHAPYLSLPLRGAELFEAKVKKLIAARLEMEKKSVETLKKQ